MNSAWTSLTVPLLRRQARPLLELFNGYARGHGGRAARGNTAPWQPRPPPVQHITWPQRQHTRPFTATVQACAGTRSPRPPPATKYDPNAAPVPETPSKLEPAATVASHTEGISPEDEEGTVTWRDYDPDGGMPLPVGELPQPQINSVFGSEDVDVDTGNYIINVMHWRRQSGALIDTGLDFPRASEVTRSQALQALEYVRSLDPAFDEQGAGQTWATEESLRLQAEIQQRAISLGLYKKEPEDYEDEQTEQGTEEGRARTGESVLVSQRKQREAQWEQEQATQKAKQARDEQASLHSARGPLELAGGIQPAVALTTTGPGGIAIGQGPRSAWLAPVERKPWVKYYEEQANLIKDNILPQISLPGRLVPALLVTAATLALCLFLSDNYTPPPRSARVWPNTPPAVATLTTITFVLTTMFIASRAPLFWRSLNKYCTIVPAYPHAISVLGYTLRHDTLVHLAINTATLWAFSLTLHDDVGRGTYIAILVASGAVGGFVSLTATVLRKQWTSYAYGVSAAALGVVAATCTLKPHGTLKLGSVELPFAAWILIVILAGVDVVAVVKGKGTGVDHYGHLGGIATGLAGAVYLRRKAARAGPGVMERNPAVGAGRQDGAVGALAERVTG
ncbi:hypothetical protein LTR53_003103 [Teratosphaeriaceae sp. CCFEE 6253]|nr:hypothetical protein LTR53_003103 [Teratosphaeriaceae sp. CCFEE 6253]